MPYSSDFSLLSLAASQQSHPGLLAVRGRDTEPCKALRKEEGQGMGLLVPLGRRRLSHGEQGEAVLTLVPDPA